jgi:hypothetical protein
MLDVLGIKHADKLVPLEDDQKPKDPVTENMNVFKGKPVKAFMYQNHEAHLTVHQMAAQDPLLQQAIGQNPQAQAIQAALQAHIAEHLGYAYRQKIEQALGAPLPNPEKDIPEDMEVQISQMVAQAAPVVLAQSQAVMAQQQAMQNAQDPVLQAQLMDQQIKQGDLERKTMKDQADIQLKTRELEIKEQQIQADSMQKAASIDINAQTQADNKKKHAVDTLLEVSKQLKESEPK